MNSKGSGDQRSQVAVVVIVGDNESDSVAPLFFREPPCLRACMGGGGEKARSKKAGITRCRT